MTANKAIAVMLDNASSTRQVTPLLPASDTSLAMITTRSRLPSLVDEGAHYLSLQPLDDDAGVELLCRLVGEGRVAAEQGDARRLVRLCAGLPIALSVVGAQLAARPLMRLARIVHHLEDECRRLRALALRDGPSVQAVFDLSYRALPAEVARVFRLIGMHPGTDFGIEVAAAAADVSIDAATDALAVLLSGHLVEEVGDLRFRLHDLLRLYARGLAAAADEDAMATQRIVEWYLRATMAADDAARPGRRRLAYRFRHECVPSPSFDDPPSALDWLEAERAALISCVREAIDAGLPELAWQVADMMWSLFLYRTYLADRMEVNRLGIEAAKLWGSPFAEARMTYQLGLAHNDLGEYREATERLTDAMRLRETIGDREGAMNVVEGLGFVCMADNRPAEAVNHFERVLRFNTGPPGRPRRAALSTLNLGRALLECGRLDEARERLDEANRLFETTSAEDVYNHTRLRTFLAKTALAKGDPERAAELATQVAARMAELGSVFGEAEAVEVLGDIAAQSDTWTTARHHYARAFDLFDRLGVPEARRVRDRMHVPASRKAED